MNSATVTAASSHTSMHSCTDTCMHAQTHARTHTLTNNEYFGLVGLMHAPTYECLQVLSGACVCTHPQPARLQSTLFL